MNVMNVEQLFDDISADKLADLTFQTQLYRVLTTVFITNSFEHSVVSRYIYDYYGGKVAKEHIDETVEYFLAGIQLDPELCIDGVLTDTSNTIAVMHMQMFNKKEVVYN